MRVGFLRRDVDVSGLSGTGVVAEIAEFSDGVTVLRWLSQPGQPDGVRPTTVIHDSIASVVALHSHHGQSSIRWLD